MPRVDLSVSLEDRFWSRVWRCHHRQPCRKCCWPWRQLDGLYRLTDSYGHFYDPRLSKTMKPSNQCVIYFKSGMLVLNSKRILALHRCDYPPCCNPVHIFPGSHSDNTRDMWQRRIHAPISLPDGVLLSSSNQRHSGPAGVGMKRRGGPKEKARLHTIGWYPVFHNDYQGIQSTPSTLGLWLLLEKLQRPFLRSGIIAPEPCAAIFQFIKRLNISIVEGKSHA